MFNKMMSLLADRMSQLQTDTLLQWQTSALPFNPPKVTTQAF